MPRHLTLTLALTLGIALGLGTLAPGAEARTWASATTRPVDVAHRGASAYAPENTVAAFQLAARLGADLFELDVQETKDHELVLMHDTTLSRTTDVEDVYPGLSPWRVGDLTLAQIRRLDAGSWAGPRYAGEPVPTLGDALDAMAGTGMGLLLEVKAPELYPGIERRIADELRRHPAWQAPGLLVVQSFDWRSMRTLHGHLPHVPIGLLGTPPAAELPRLATFADLVNPSYTTLTAAYVERVHALGMRTLAWTVDSPSAMRRMLDHGVDGIITNRPDVLRELLDS
ncbi:Glycerophosphoryl diester phosphodiesterase [Nonomuraea coxensis DSM 45129]|uniref:Glycerophosphoryl diester phosphodiesterase n=1 Tax=Nonomuraea coxensis DSM 45129 TaxID=1122611 RepID=A0ABX8U800_9ACTN|nr:glycerophosphodiester phosphodiesterase family protein [Nonomuraea coxensis]QYC43849.1 Glycerophosphoryl diester phosphodiesterase [Nonomuraea coxensis DSM 45129]